MQGFELRELLPARQIRDATYVEFLREPSMNCGIYVLPAGQPDPQEPHAQDELYYVIEGQGRFESEDQDYEVGAGTLLYVERQKPHRFHSITEDLTILVVFAGEESS